eukprot:m.155574 g.155574  ORF g.155574 m.155574 type:complete len:100 (+) comp30940_c0_seq1:1957-2256(+)
MPVALQNKTTSSLDFQRVYRDNQVLSMPQTQFVPQGKAHVHPVSLFVDLPSKSQSQIHIHHEPPSFWNNFGINVHSNLIIDVNIFRSQQKVVTWFHTRS